MNNGKGSPPTLNNSIPDSLSPIEDAPNLNNLHSTQRGNENAKQKTKKKIRFSEDQILRNLFEEKSEYSKKKNDTEKNLISSSSNTCPHPPNSTFGTENVFSSREHKKKMYALARKLHKLPTPKKKRDK